MTDTEHSTSIRAVFWDFGGVILSSPFDAFNDYERSRGLPIDFIRTVNATNPDTNVWARIERREVDADTFDGLFADESATLGHRIPGSDVLAMLSGTVRPAMVRALERVNAAGYITACLTNNVRHPDPRSSRPEVDAVMELFDHVVESSELGCRKPEPRFYELACEIASVSPNECVFLDDLGINLKPARAMGMSTIKVVGPDQAIDDLEAVLGRRIR